jgi:hypothetical protein
MTMTDLTAAEIAEIEQRFESFDPGTAVLYGPGDDVPPELALVQAQAARALYERRADQVMREAVDKARDAGLSWHKIGLRLGTTGEAARQRYARKKVS